MSENSEVYAVYVWQKDEPRVIRTEWDSEKNAKKVADLVTELGHIVGVFNANTDCEIVETARN